jgi:D-glycerate 3-kinase
MDREGFTLFLKNWLGELVSAAPRKGRPILVGLSAPQGAGKTTLAREFCQLASEDGLHAISISIDDFYLKRQEQIDLARRHSNNPYLQRRGYPGTHDIDLGTRVLKALKTLGERGCVALPSYDRSASAGMGDRRTQADWPIVHAPLDLAILEGWMLGFTSVEPDTLPNPHLRVINEYLRQYAVWLSYLDAFVWLEPVDPRFVLDWRVEAEERSRAKGNAGMSTAEIKAFVEGFLPAYLVYLPGLRERPPVSGPFLRVLIGHDRLPTADLPK